MAKLRIVITGATGLLGRNLMFEVIKQNLSNLGNLELIVLGRDFGGKKLKDRIFNILRDDGKRYILSDVNKINELLVNLEGSIRCLSADLEQEGLGLNEEGFNCLSKNPIDIFYHVGASTDLRLGLIIEKKLYDVNVNGTRRILQLVSQLKIGEFCYVGTAYSCGSRSGKIRPDIVNIKQKFRNPYERTKLEAEVLVREYAKAQGLRCRFFRPSVICGRLIEKPLGAMSKFDVFYGWAAFFLKMKKKEIGNKNELYKKRINLDIRICFNKDSGLNIVPADYSAKVMYQVCLQNDPGINYHVVNNQETPHEFYISEMLKTINVGGIEFVNKIPKDCNQNELLYYKTAGRVFTPYITTKSMYFDVDNVLHVLQDTDIQCPLINKENLNYLLTYAKNHDFGIS